MFHLRARDIIVIGDSYRGRIVIVRIVIGDVANLTNLSRDRG